MKNIKKWMQGLNLKKGSLTNYILKKHGKKAFTKHGTIKLEYLNKESKSKNPRVKKMANLAKVFRSHRNKNNKRFRSKRFGSGPIGYMNHIFNQLFENEYTTNDYISKSISNYNPDLGENTKYHKKLGYITTDDIESFNELYTHWAKSFNSFIKNNLLKVKFDFYTKSNMTTIKVYYNNKEDLLNLLKHKE